MEKKLSILLLAGSGCTKCTSNGVLWPFDVETSNEQSSGGLLLIRACIMDSALVPDWMKAKSKIPRVMAPTHTKKAADVSDEVQIVRVCFNANSS